MMDQKNELQAAVQEAEALATAISEIADDGRRLAADLAQRINDIANLQCSALDARADALQQRIAELKRQLAA